MQQALSWQRNTGSTVLHFPQFLQENLVIQRKEACRIAVETVKNWMKNNCDYSMKIVFSCVDPTIYELMYSELNDVEKE